MCHWQGSQSTAHSPLVLTPRITRDVNAFSKGNSSIEPLNVFDDHTAVVGVGSASLGSGLRN